MIVRQLVKTMWPFFSFLSISTIALWGCGTTSLWPPDIPKYEQATQHYRTVERFHRVAIDAGLGSLAAEMQPSSVVSEIAHYLERNSIEFVSQATRDEKVATLKLLLTPNDTHYVVHASLFAPDGSVVEETSLYHQGGSQQALAQELASLVVDDLLLIWHPAKEAVRATSSPSPARFTLLANDIEPQSMSGASRLSWETFPSERLLKGSGITAADVSDVSYELRVHKVHRPLPFADRQKRSGVYRVAGLKKADYVLPFILPSCRGIVWSVRAHFRLNEYPRVTEWSGDYSTYYNKVGRWPLLPPYMYRRTLDLGARSAMYAPWPLQHFIGGGTFTRIEPPPPVKCGERERGFLADESKRAAVDFEQPIEPLQAGQSIAAFATVTRTCISDKCGYDEGVSDASDEFASCLSNEFSRRRMDAPVRKIPDILPQLPVPPIVGSTNAEALVTALKVPANRQYLLDKGIRYILSADVTTEELGRPSETLTVGTLTRVTRYASSFDSEVIDTSTGETIGRISSIATGGKGGTIAFVVIVPVFYIPHGSISGIEAKACDAVARQMSFMLRGGISLDWPSEAFASEFAPLWEQE